MSRRPFAAMGPTPIRWSSGVLRPIRRTRGQTSLEFKTLTDKPENAYLKQIPNVVAVGGGVLIKVGNEVIGAVGVSGAPGGEKGEVCANAGIAKVAGSLQ
jgi:uncharacterized protein GlcG (DUF336 family)